MAESTTKTPTRADYGLDAPGIIRMLAIIGILSLVAAFTWPQLQAAQPAIQDIAIRPSLLWMGWALLAGSAMMIVSSTWGKLRARDRLLDRFQFNGNETVLDVGCGHGLLLIAAAKRVPTGKAIGVDLWSQVDQKDNSSAATMANARAEGVADRVDVRDGDMRQLPLDDASVDLVVSCLAIHNVSGSADRRKAIREIVRVLKPGGYVGIIDIAHIGEYVDEFRKAGMSSVTTHGFTPWIYPPTRVMTATK